MDVDPKAQFERFQKALKTLYEIDLEEHGQGVKACQLLGITSQQLTNWKSRGLPNSALQIIAVTTRINPAYILGVDTAMALRPQPIENGQKIKNDRSIKAGKRR